MRFSPHRNEHGERMYCEACRKGLEGVMAKRADSPYRASRSSDWRKLKCHAEQELVIGGYTAPQGSRTDFGALLVGYWEDDRLRYAGKVGTGFDHVTLPTLGKRLRELEQDDAPFADVHPVPRGAHWGEARAGGPDRVHRVDARRAPAPPAFPRAARRQAGPRGREGAAGVTVKISSPDKLLFPADGLTKADLAGYYEGVAEWMLPHVRNRPLSMLRYPDGIDGEGFFHKNVPEHYPSWVKRVEVEKRGGTVDARARDQRRLARVPGGAEHDHAARLALARRRLRQPDRLVFDLDPAPGADFAAVRRAARAHRRPAARDRHGAVRPGDGLQGHPRLDAAAPARQPSPTCAHSRARLPSCSPPATPTS